MGTSLQVAGLTGFGFNLLQGFLELILSSFYVNRSSVIEMTGGEGSLICPKV